MVTADRGFFVGEFRHQMDSKGRLTIPSKWRFRGDEADVFLGLPNAALGCITVYPPKMIAQLEERVSKISIGDIEGQQILAQVAAYAHSFGCDKQGRINLNDRLIDHAGIEKEAVLLGSFATFSIWSPERFAARDQPLTEPPSPELVRMMEGLKKFGF